MKIYIDSQTLRHFIAGQVEVPKQFLVPESKHQMAFGWPTFLEYLGLGSLFKQIPEFSQNKRFFDLCITTLSSDTDQDILFYMYDSLFAECLTQIKGLPQINHTYLLDSIQNQRSNAAMAYFNDLFAHPLEQYEKYISEEPGNALHDLTLYLAWDRMCVCLADIFDFQTENINFMLGITVLKDCLIESFQHITMQKRTAPGFYKLMEAVFFYQMREENLQTPSESDWIMLSQSFEVLKPRGSLADFYYIDMALADDRASRPDDSDNVVVITMDSEDQINARLALADYTLQKLKDEFPDWHYSLKEVNIVHLKI